ncbi:murein L,D-transpeptidase [Kaistia geumhonensis]|uniref:Murein L,D-transpeptidase YafK n=1 Tax=Kaistia geumhonensis TaxID=410839 RepID=A0ABU0M8W4_9HYPH|nr:murein L,D-transpeptidase family protein [Kaistia geumhonensis]MCX5477384.1 murein L,D-transpeptidase [Kaistia geumhonensis]MDQ0517409.1 murein L,D-transpeptidase YafK [Kaistia geumhonensis]
MLRQALTGRLIRAVLVVVAGLLLAACEEAGYGGPKHLKPVPQKLVDKMHELDMPIDSAVYVRGYKESSELEVWKKTRSGSYKLLTTYSICKWSGKLGPKLKEGDRQAPEGFYTITPGQMNPKSAYYLSFNIGFPNAYDRALGRTGTNIMVHGACSSAGCYSMTDEAAGEIYALARDSFRGGQRSFEVHLFPFRMTPENMARHRYDPNYAFWVMLKEGSDNFVVTGQVPKVGVCGKRYVFNANASTRLNASAPCPPLNVSSELVAAVKAKQAKDDVLIAELAPKYEEERQIAAAKAAEQAARIAAMKEANAQKPVEAVAAAPADGAAPGETAAAPVAAGDNAALAVAEPAAGAASPAGDAADALAMASIGGTPAPGMPLPVASPIRPVVPVVEQPQPSGPGWWGKIKQKIPKVPNPFG